MKPLTAILVAGLIAVVLTSIVLEQVLGAGPDEPGPITSSDAVTIDVFSSNTKENWINAVVEQFNQEQHTIASGEPIFVRANAVIICRPTLE